MNRITLMGRLTRDPEIKTYGSEGKTMANITLAVDRRFKRDGEPTADFFSCTVFGGTATVLEKYCFKGTKLLVEGECQDNNYEDKNGVKHYSKRVLISSIEFCESKKNSSGGSSEPQAQPKTDGDGWMDVEDDEADALPFN